jgi:toxin ParE1/3/4
MAAFRLSGDAFQDIKAIHRYSLRNFGQDRADRYAIDLEACLALLANHPFMGRDFGKVRDGLRRHEHQSHVVYYRQDGDDILILRILGAEQDPGRYL